MALDWLPASAAYRMPQLKLCSAGQALTIGKQQPTQACRLRNDSRILQGCAGDDAAKAPNCTQVQQIHIGILILQVARDYLVQSRSKGLQSETSCHLKAPSLQAGDTWPWA